MPKITLIIDGKTNNALSRTAGDKLPATAILYAFLTLIYDFFMPYSPVTVTLYCVTATHNLHPNSIKSNNYCSWNKVRFCISRVFKFTKCMYEIAVASAQSIATSSPNSRGWREGLFHFHSNLLFVDTQCVYCPIRF